jgi:hypothetical protein
MSRHTVNIDRDHHIWSNMERTLASQMSDAKLEEQTSKLKLTITVKRLQVRCCFFEGFWGVTEGKKVCFTGNESQWKLHNNYRQRSDIQDLLHAIQKLLWLKTRRARNWSSVNLCTYYFNYSQQNYVEKGNLTVKREIYTISLAVR